MIFITLGSQKFQFNRLLIELDKLVGNGTVKEEIFAQIGYSDYKPKNYKYKDFLDREEFGNYMQICDTIITHGGTGAIIGAIKKQKKVIAIPRIKHYGEHVDNHQLEIVSQFKEMNLIESVMEIEELGDKLFNLNKLELNNYISNTENIVKSIEEDLLVLLG